MQVDEFLIKHTKFVNKCVKLTNVNFQEKEVATEKMQEIRDMSQSGILYNIEINTDTRHNY